MKELIKKFKEQENIAFKEFFKLAPNYKSELDILMLNLNDNTPNLIMLNNNIKETNKFFKTFLKNHLNDTNKISNEIKNAYHNNIKSIKEDLKKEHLNISNNFFPVQEEIKKTLQEARQKYLTSSSKLTKRKSDFKQNCDTEKDLLDKQVEEKRITYLDRVSSLYKQKVSEEERINNKYADQLNDYEEKNKERLLQNDKRLQQEDKAFDDFEEFHEKDAIYARQNYFRTVTNLNNKINSISKNYKKIEDKTNSKLVSDKDKIKNHLKQRKEKLDKLNNNVLNDFEKKYAQIDIELDKIRKNYNEEETTLKNKYYREVTSINVDDHNAKEEIEKELSSLKNKKTENIQEQKIIKKQIKTLKKKLKTLTKNTNTLLKQAKKEYTKSLFIKSNDFVEKYETTLHKRTLLEEEKNETLNFYDNILSLDEQTAINKNNLLKEQTALKQEIIELHKQLEITPIESQSELASQIYNLEVTLQSLENDFMISFIARKKESINLKSNLHKYNLNKTRDRINFNYKSELNISNLTKYLQMEVEKNELVKLKQQIRLQKKQVEETCLKEFLKLDHNKELNKANMNYEIQLLNNDLKHKMALKSHHENLVENKLKYKINKEKFLTQHNYNKLQDENFKTLILKERSFFSDYLLDFQNLINALHEEEKEIISAFTSNALKPVYIDSFNTFLKNTLNLLIIKHNLITSIIKTLTKTIKEYLKNKIDSLKFDALKKKNSKTFETYNTKIKTINKNKKHLLDKKQAVNDKIKSLDDEINILSEQRRYALETVVFSQKELKSLHNQKLTTKKKRLTENLKDQIEINKALSIRRNNNIKDLKKHLKEHKKEKSKLNKLLKQNTNFANNIEKKKNDSLKRLNLSLNKKTSIFYKLLKQLNYITSKSLNRSEDYLNYLNKLLLEERPLLKKIKHLNTLVLAKENYTTSFIQSVILTVNNQTRTILKKNTSLRNTEIKYENNNLQILANDYLKKDSELKRKITSLNKSVVNKNEHLKKERLKNIKNLLIQQNDAVKQKEKEISNIKEEIIKLKEHQKKMDKAFIINKEESIKNVKDSLKNDLKESLKNNQRLIKNTKKDIIRIEKEISYDQKRHKTQQNYSFNKDKQARNRITKKQNSTTNQLNRKINSLKRKLPKLDEELTNLKNKRTKEELNLRKKLHHDSYFKNLLDNIKLKFLILKEKRNHKKELIEELYNEKAD